MFVVIVANHNSKQKNCKHHFKYLKEPFEYSQKYWMALEWLISRIGIGHFVEEYYIVGTLVWGIILMILESQMMNLFFRTPAWRTFNTYAESWISNYENYNALYCSLLWEKTCFLIWHSFGTCFPCRKLWENVANSSELGTKSIWWSWICIFSKHSLCKFKNLSNFPIHLRKSNSKSSDYRTC